MGKDAARVVNPFGTRYTRDDMQNADWLEKLIAHEAAYFGFAAEVEKTPFGWFLTGADLPDYRDANHAMRLRDEGRGAEAVAQAVISYYRSRGLPPVADVDAVAEAQGIGAALRRRGVTPVIGNTLLMRYPSALPAEPPTPNALHTTPDTKHLNPIANALPISNIQRPTPVSIAVVPNETGAGEAAAWVETALAGGFDGRLPFWRRVLEREARSLACRLYLADCEGQHAAACDLFEADGWARMDNVGTRSNFRRRGIASTLVRRVIEDAQANGNNLLYLFTEAGGDGERLYRKLGFVPWKLNPFRQHIGD